MPSYCISCGNITKSITLDEPLSIHSSYFEELTMQLYDEFIATAKETPTCKSVNPTEEEQLRKEIVNLRRRVRRCRNGFESTNLNRQIASLEDELRRIRVQL